MNKKCMNIYVYHLYDTFICMSMWCKHVYDLYLIFIYKFTYEIIWVQGCSRRHLQEFAKLVAGELNGVVVLRG